MHNIVATQHIGDGNITVRVVHLRGVHRLIHLKPTASKSRQPRHHALKALLRGQVWPTHQRMYRNRASINHRIARSARIPLQRQLVKRLTRRLHIYLEKHVIKTTIRQRERIHKRLRDGLDRKLMVNIAHPIHLTIQSGEHSGQTIRVSGCQLWNIAGKLPGLIQPHRLKDFFKIIRNRRFHALCVSHRQGALWQVGLGASTALPQRFYCAAGFMRSQTMPAKTTSGTIMSSALLPHQNGSKSP